MTMDRARGVTPHVAQNTSERSGTADGRTPRHLGYALSRRARYRGMDRTGLVGYLVATAYNLVRMAKLLVSQQKEALATQAA